MEGREVVRGLRSFDGVLAPAADWDNQRQILVSPAQKASFLRGPHLFHKTQKLWVAPNVDGL